jgi:hypothetical protein
MSCGSSTANGSLVSTDNIVSLGSSQGFINYILHYIQLPNHKHPLLVQMLISISMQLLQHWLLLSLFA